MNNPPDSSSSESFDRKDVFQWFKRHEKQVSDVAKNNATLTGLTAKSESLLTRFSKHFSKETVSSLTTFVRMIKEYVSGRYTDLSKTTFLSLTGALIYFVSPLDVVPDVIPVLGMTDDIFVLGYTATKAIAEIRKFRFWERCQKVKPLFDSLPRAEVRRVIVCPGWLSGLTDHANILKSINGFYPNAKIELFSWPSVDLWTPACQEVDGQSSDRLLETILSGSVPAGQTALVGHSLGGRIVVRTGAKLTALRREAVSQEERNRLRLHHLLLMGSAIDNDDPDILKAAESSEHPVYNFYGKADRILGYLYRFQEQKTPLGLYGLAQIFAEGISVSNGEKKEDNLSCLVDKLQKAAPANYGDTPFVTDDPEMEDVADRYPDCCDSDDVSDSDGTSDGDTAGDSAFYYGNVPNYIDLKVSGSEEYLLGVTANLARLTAFLRSPTGMLGLMDVSGMKEEIADIHQHDFMNYVNFAGRCFEK